MTTVEWPQADPRLERWYQRLLLAYPGRFRRRHGAAIVTTLLEMSEPGRRRPAAADIRHLLVGGVRQRFRLPAGRPLVLLAAVLVSLIGGGLGAAAGSWTATRTFAGLPADAELRAIPRSADTRVIRSASPWWSELAITRSAQVDTAWDVERTRRELTADGWRVGDPRIRDERSTLTRTLRTDPGGRPVPGPGDQVIETRTVGAEFEADRDGVRMKVTGYTSNGYGSNVFLELWPEDPGVLLPLTVLGGLLGLAGGWLLSVAVAYRRSRWTTALTAVAVPALALPAVAFYGNMIRAFRHTGEQGPVFDVHSALTPGPYWPFGPGWLNLALTAGGLTVAAAAVLLSARGAAAVARTEIAAN